MGYLLLPTLTCQEQKERQRWQLRQLHHAQCTAAIVVSLHADTSSGTTPPLPALFSSPGAVLLQKGISFESEPENDKSQDPMLGGSQVWKA
ncbi:UNVERIFIED_CONTAM: hypothetical protein K2H54_056264 [Gekko kuhli]